MSNELEIKLAAAEAEILRLQSGFDELISWIKESEYSEELDNGLGDDVVNAGFLIKEINRITGVSE